MKRSKLLTILLASALTFSIGACGNTNNQDPAKTIKDIQKVDENINEEGNLETTYTITFLDGTEYTFTVKNGKDGEQGIQGEPGKDGHTPTIEIGENGNWIIDGKDSGISSKGEDGADGTNGKDGNSIVSITKTNTEGLIDTYTITFSDGTTTTFTVVNGKDGEQGIQGDPGKDGKTPTIEVSENGTWVINGIDTGLKAIGVNGTNGEDGKDGLSAYEIYIKYHPEYTGTEEEWIDDLINDRLGDNDEAYHTVTLDLNGGTYDGQTEFKVKDGETIENLPIPTKVLEINGSLETFKFIGWYSGISVNDGKVTNVTSINSNITLIAAYSKCINTYLDENNEILEQSITTTMPEVEIFTFYKDIKDPKNNKTYLYEQICNGLLIKDQVFKPIHIVDDNLIPEYVTSWNLVTPNSSQLNETGLIITIAESDYSFPKAFQIDNEICGLKVLGVEIYGSLTNLEELTLNEDLINFTCERAYNLKALTLNKKLEDIRLNSLSNLSEINYNNNTSLSSFTIEYCHKISTITLNNLSHINEISIYSLDNLSQFEISNSDFSSFQINKCPSLKDVKFSNVNFTVGNDNNFSIISDSLTKLDLSTLNYKIPNNVTDVTIGCTSLNELILPETIFPEMIYSMFVSFITTDNLVIKNKDFLQAINFSRLNLDCSITQKTQLILEDLKLYCPISLIGAENESITHLIFKNCALFGYFENLGQINKLTFENCENINLSNLLRNFSYNDPYLKELEFLGNTKISPILEPIFTTNNLPSLTDIYFNGTQEEREALEISESNTLLFDGSVTIHFEEA